MSDLKSPTGFEDALPAPPPHRRTPQNGPSGAWGEGARRAALSHIVSHAPQAMVKVNGRIHSSPQLRAHLDYISRKGKLALEDQDRSIIVGRSAIKDLADDWSVAARLDVGGRANTPIVLALVPSMPPGTDPALVRDAARDLARERFAGRFGYAFVLHTDTPNPHVHLTIRWLGDDGDHLRPGPADLRVWRETFAQALRDRGVQAEATPRWIRGVTRRAERTPIRKMREAYEAGEGPLPRVLVDVYHDAYRAVLSGETGLNPWEKQILKRQAEVRSFFAAQTEQLAQSSDPADRALARQVEAFAQSMPPPDSQRLSVARQIQAAKLQLQQEKVMKKDQEMNRAKAVRLWR